MKVHSNIKGYFSAYLKNTLPVKIRPLRFYLKTLLPVILGLVLFKMGFKYIQEAHPGFQEVISMFYGFAPLLGLSAILFIVAILFSILICSAERALTGDCKSSVPEPARKSKWHIVRNISISGSAIYIYLKEHSPPEAFFLH